MRVVTTDALSLSRGDDGEHLTCTGRATRSSERSRRSRSAAAGSFTTMHNARYQGRSEPGAPDTRTARK